MTLTSEQIRCLENDACSYADIIRYAWERYGIEINYRHVSSMIDAGQLSREHIAANYRTQYRAQQDRRMFISGKKITQSMKKRLRELRNHRCEQCGTTEEWEGGSLVLQVHHIDGNRTNNQLDNLMLLCPNCHALTDNFGIKNMLSSVDENLIRDLYDLAEGDLAKTIELADLPLNQNTVSIIKDALGIMDI